MTDDGAHEQFDDALDRYAGSPIELRLLLLAADAVRGSERRLRNDAIRDLREITGVQHRTYGAAANALMAVSFPRSGGYWLSFLRDGHDDPRGLLRWFRKKR